MATAENVQGRLDRINTALAENPGYRRKLGGQLLEYNWGIHGKWETENGERA